MENKLERDNINRILENVKCEVNHLFETRDFNKTDFPIKVTNSTCEYIIYEDGTVYLKPIECVQSIVLDFNITRTGSHAITTLNDIEKYVKDNISIISDSTDGYMVYTQATQHFKINSLLELTVNRFEEEILKQKKYEENQYLLWKELFKNENIL